MLNELDTLTRIDHTVDCVVLVVWEFVNESWHF